MLNMNTPAAPMPHLAELFAAFEDAKCNFIQAREAALARKAEAAKMTRSADDAEGEATKAKADRQELIRSANAAPKKLRDLVAQERAAYSLAEDYRELANEHEAAFEEVKFHAEDCAKRMLTVRESAINLQSEHVLSTAVGECTDLYKAMSLHVSACIAEDGGTANSKAVTMGYESATDRAIQYVLKRVRDHFLEHRNSMESDAVHSNFSLAPGWQDFDPRNVSLATRHRQRVLAEEKAANASEQRARTAMETGC